MRIVKSAIASLVNDPSEWVRIDLLERELEMQTTDFDTRTYGHVRLRDPLVALKRPFVVDAPRGSAARVRARVAKSARKIAAPNGCEFGRGERTSARGRLRP
jgi:hypothetical protein